LLVVWSSTMDNASPENKEPDSYQISHQTAKARSISFFFILNYSCLQ